MTSEPPHDPSRKPPGQSEPSEKALRRLEERLDRASEVAERLIVEAAARVAQGSESGDPEAVAGDPEAVAGNPEAVAVDPGSSGASEPPGAEEPKPPPAGWQRRDDTADGATAAPSPGDLDLLVQILRALRDRIPPELQHRLGEALREVLLAIRALIDWYLERTERPRSESVQVEDIPII